MIDSESARTRWPAWLVTWLLVIAFGVRASEAAAPTITQQPPNSLATTNEDIALTVTATGDAPLQYQWLFNGGGIAGATNSSLLITNVNTGQSGTYSVTVSNVAGGITSSNAVLFISTNIVHRLGTGRLLQIGSSVGVPITFRSNGRESAVSFSLAYDTNVFANPTFTPSDTTAAVMTDTTRSNAIGVAITLPGVAITLPGGAMFPAGYETLGLVKFDLAAGKTALAGGLSFTNTPTPIAAVNTNGQTLLVLANVLPQFTLVTPTPVLRLQSGLFEHQLIVSNPGSTPMTNVNILPLKLGVDSKTNAITLFNAQVTQTANPYGDPLVSVDCNCACGLVAGAATDTCAFDQYLACQNANCSIDYFATNATFLFAQLSNLLPGESRIVTLEYYVTDHATVPAPAYSLFLANPFVLIQPPTIITTLAIDVTRYISNSAIVEFSTRLGNQYFIQWSDSAAGLATGKVVFPPVFGTGSRVQWIDNGPPKTDTPPTNHQRFYQVLSDQRQ